MLTKERAIEILEYDHSSGHLTWRENRGGKAKRGERAGSIHVDRKANYSYRQLSIDGKNYREHIVIWLMVTGSLPSMFIDHENQDATDNRWSNLRLATRSENAKNQRRQTRTIAGATGVTGVNWSKALGKYRAKIRTGGRCFHLGYFDRLDDATSARRAAEMRLGFSPNHGK
jgi:hypothetical protein